MEKSTSGLNAMVNPGQKKTTTKPTTSKGVGLNAYVKSITPEISKDGFQATERAIFVCTKGHTFHASFSQEKKNQPQPLCPKCNKFAFRLDELIKTKQFIFGVAHHLKMPDISVPLKFLVETQNRRNAASDLARKIEVAPFSKLVRISEHVFASEDKDSKFMALLDLVSKSLKSITDLAANGNTQAAQTIKGELVSVLNGN